MSALLLRAIRDAHSEALAIRRDAAVSIGHVPDVDVAVLFWLDSLEDDGADCFDCLVELEQRLVIAAFRRAYLARRIGYTLARPA